MIKIHHSTIDGRELIHLGDDPILFKTYMTCNYTPDKPWVTVLE